MQKTKRTKEQILVVEDHHETARTVKLYLDNAGYDSRIIHDGIEALHLLEQHEFALVILDIMLPGIDGRSILERLRESDQTPVILLTAMGSENQRIEGFNLGADDYVVKPFSPRELVARVKARLKSGEKRPRQNISHGPFIMNLEEHLLEYEGRKISLTPTEFSLFKIFLSSPHRVFTRTELSERLFGFGYEGDDKTIASHVHNLRNNVARVCGGQTYIHTVFGVGYRFMIEDF